MYLNLILFFHNLSAISAFLFFPHTAVLLLIYFCFGLNSCFLQLLFFFWSNIWRAFELINSEHRYDFTPSFHCLPALGPDDLNYFPEIKSVYILDCFRVFVLLWQAFLPYWKKIHSIYCRYTPLEDIVIVLKSITTI